MSLVALLKKELHWSKRNLLVLIFLLLIIPGFFAATSVIFQDIVPRDLPVAVVAENENVSDDEVSFVENGIKTWTKPNTADTRAKAERMLERESVYAIVVVPPDYLAEGSNATFSLVIDGRIAPFLEPSELIQDLIEFELQAADAISDDVSVEREIIGEEKTLAEYLFPTFMMGLLIFFAFTYVPYSLRRDAPVIERLRVESSLEAVVSAKLLYVTALMVIPIAVFHGAVHYYDYGVNTISLWAIGILLLTFVFLSTVSMTIMIFTRFSGSGQFVNLVMMLGLIALSGLAFPLGFFSPLRTTIAQVLPTYYSMVMVRSFMLKDVDPGLFSDWLVGLVALQIAALVALKGTIVYYRRSS